MVPVDAEVSGLGAGPLFLGKSVAPHLRSWLGVLANHRGKSNEQLAIEPVLEYIQYQHMLY